VKVAFLTRYGALGASSRVRATQFGPALKALGLRVSFWPLLADPYLERRYAGRTAWREVLAAYFRRLRQLDEVRAADLLWIEKELLPFLPYAVEARLLRGRRYVLDFDDAIFHNYDMSGSAVVRRLLGRKIDRLMAGSTMVTAGNEYLATRARAAGCRRVERLPSVVDLDGYPIAHSAALAANAPLRVVWIGSPSTVGYLELVRAPLQRVATWRAVQLRVIGATPPRWAGVEAIGLPWSQGSEAHDIAAADVGIMPLRDSPWERGKCGYKLIQYMACGLPVIAAPVGVNAEIVSDGVDGLLAQSDEQWENALLRLAVEPALRQQMGARGRAKVETHYSVQALAPRLAHLLRGAAD